MRLRVATSKSFCGVKMIGGGGTTTKVFLGNGAAIR